MAEKLSSKLMFGRNGILVFYLLLLPHSANVHIYLYVHTHIQTYTQPSWTTNQFLHFPPPDQTFQEIRALESVDFITV